MHVSIGNKDVKSKQMIHICNPSEGAILDKVQKIDFPIKSLNGNSVNRITGGEQLEDQQISSRVKENSSVYYVEKYLI